MPAVAASDARLNASWPNCSSRTPTPTASRRTDVENIPEQRSLKAAGFQQEGLIRGAHYRHGAHRDGYLYSILRGDLAPAQTPEHGHA